MTSTTTSTRTPSRFRWRVVDIVIAAVIAVACGVVFFGWNIANPIIFTPVQLAVPGLEALGYGPWLIAGPLAALIIRKPGAALFGELVAASVSALLGAQWGIQTLESGLVQGLAAEIAFLIFAYRLWSWPVAVLSGALAGLAAGINDWIFYYQGLAPQILALYIGAAVISGAVIAGFGAWLIVKGLAKTGALSRFPSGREAERV